MKDRIDLIDALRGLALGAIGVVHFGEQYLGAMPPRDHMAYAGTLPIDRVLDAASFLFLRGKGFALFSLLFGLSFAIQMQAAAVRTPGQDFRPRFAWRLLVLGLIGIVHGLVYAGDILLIYALLGLPLLLFYGVRGRWLWIVAILLLVGTPRVILKLALPPATTAQLEARQAANEEGSIRHFSAAKHGPTSELIRGNLQEMLVARMDFQLGVFSRGYQTFGLFLIGLWLGRHRIFEDLDRYRAGFKKLFWWTLVPGLILPVVGFAFAIARALGPPEPAPPGGPPLDLWTWPFVAGLCVYDIWNASMSAFLVSAFALVSGSPAWRKRLLWFAPVGRTALTSYLLQTVLGSLLFFHFGLGLLGDIGNHLTLPLGVLAFVVMVGVSRIWLTHFHYGPIEWLWRSATFLRVQPFRKAA
jgi:uncharacterized protein